MSRFSGAKFRLWIGQPVHAPSVRVPFSLRIMVFVCVLSVTATLLYAVWRQLESTSTLGISPAHGMFVALCYFVLPILIAKSIATNRPVSRPLIVVYTIAIAYQVATYADVEAWMIVGATAFVVAVLLWLYWYPRTRVYYCQIKGVEIPAELRALEEQMTMPSRLEARVIAVSEKLADVTEHLVVIIVLFGCLYAFLFWMS